MTDEQEPIDPAADAEETPSAPAARKAAKKSAKKAVKKTAKKAVKKLAKKATKKVTKKTAKKVTSEDQAVLPIVGEDSETATEETGVVMGDDQKEVMAEAAAAERAAMEAAEAAARAAEIAREAAEKAASMALEAKKKAARQAEDKEEPKEAVESASEPVADSTEDQDKKGDEVSGIAVIRDDEPSGESGKDREKKEAPKKEEAPPPPPPKVPEEVDLDEFRKIPLSQLHEELERLPVRIPNRPTRAQLVYTILNCYATYGTRIIAEGMLEMSGGNYGMLRDELRSFRNSPDDLHLPANLIQEHGLRTGQRVRVLVREPRNRDKYLSVAEVLEVEGIPIADYSPSTHFDQLTSLFPEERFVLEGADDGGGLATRVVDLVAPLGKGQRGLIVAPPRGGKTILLKQIARSIQRNSPETELVVLLLDERPEEVTDFEEMVGRNVFASTFDEASKRHAEVANLVLERSRRLVEQGKDVVILLDSLTRLARGYNNASRGGPIGSGGISPKAITETRKFFGAARNVEEGGSLTILATCLIETESRMDDVIFEELKGTGNMEVRLDRELAEQRIYPAIHIPQSGTRNDDRLYHPDELSRVQEIRRHLASLPIGDAIETLLRNLARTKSNTELLLQGMR